MLPLVHPGPKTEPRIIARPVHTKRAVRELSGGQPVIDQLHETLASLGADSGFAEIHGGNYAPLSYCIPDVATAEKALSFSETRGHDRAHLIYGSVTLGVRDDAPYMHSHCFWQAPSGALEGGHVWLETEGDTTPPVAIVTAVFGAQWQSTTDPETKMPVFTPEQPATRPERSDLMHAATAEGHPSDTIVARVLPNVDITEALLRVCREAGFERASVRAGLGSFVGATFVDRASGEHTVVDGPATEVIALVGDVRTVDGELTTRLSCTLVDRHGEIRAGELVPGENLVAATFELTVQRLVAPVIVVD
ncbi:PPC domain-containing DNA-binding protein [Leucobacter albus]|uniref:PPC domain-containing DNA-binding protein n=1 Tax=Leucobacter albus TaxID=272210 RepID=A0ABW3TQD8_9MICO